MAESDNGDRTEAATPKRLQRARESGGAAVSREVPTLAGLAVATAVLTMAGPGLGRDASLRLAALLAHAHAASPMAALLAACWAAVLLAAPVTLGVVAAAVASTLLQTGFLLSGQALLPDFSRVSPLAGFARLFGVSALVEAGKSLLKLLLLGGAVWLAMGSAWPDLRGASLWLPGQLVDHLLQAVRHLLLMLLAAQCVITGIDLFWVRFKHGRDLRMSREEIRQESRESDGNPQIKARIRQLRLQRARKRMMAAVPKATVVVTNPTHYAIALAYDRAKGGAPRVVAKGMDDVAARIRTVANESRIPLVANPVLARALFHVELDAEIPAEHFKAVAEVIAYVWRLRGRVR